MLCEKGKLVVRRGRKATGLFYRGSRAAEQKRKVEKPFSHGEVRDSVRARIPSKGWVSRAYEGFLELPVPIVLAVLWLGGVVLIGLFVLALYLVWLLLRLGAGA
jgi:hypothetical protein